VPFVTFSETLQLSQLHQTFEQFGKVQRSAAMHQSSQFHRYYSSRIITVSELALFQTFYSFRSCITHLNSNTRSNTFQTAAHGTAFGGHASVVTVSHYSHSISSRFDRHHSSRIFTVAESALFQKHYSCHSCIRLFNSLAWYSVRRPCISHHSFTDTTAAELSQSLSQHVRVSRFRNITVVTVAPDI